jgi:hemerythrin-like domain-containing protein
MNEPPEPLAGLIREHRRIEATFAAARRALEEALAQPPAEPLLAVERLWVLQALLEDDVERHIAKEETLLFPALRDACAGLASDVDDMIAEHEQIKEQRALLADALASLDDDHDDLRSVAAELRAGLKQFAADGALTPLRPIVQQLDWLFQGHFTGEEDIIFLPAEELLSPATLATLCERMNAIDAR